MYYRVAVPSPLRRVFDYLPPESEPPSGIHPGSRVQVPFGNRKVVGMVLGKTANTDQAPEKIRPIEQLLDDDPLLSPTLLELFLWAADYYQHPVGDALLSTLPTLLRQGKALPDTDQQAWQLSTRGLGLPDNPLARAKKQQALFTVIRSAGVLSTKDLIAEGHSKAVLSALQEKELVEETRIALPDPPTPDLAESPLVLRSEQTAALKNITLSDYHCYLLFGDTGSGKTEIYLQAIEKVLAEGRQALVLVPEINLTPQTLSRFRNRFRAVIVSLHSGLTDRERLENWHLARSGRAHIIIGTRSAIFTPLQRPGIIILDEEHDPSFKQQDGFRYSARDVAVMRASREKIPLILGSATPSLESIHNGNQSRYARLDLSGESTARPRFQLVDLKQARLQSGLSGDLLEAIGEELEDGNQVLLFLNRRGYAPVLMCHDCGWRGECRHCSATLTAHLRNRQLICHHCEHRQAIPHRCEICKSPRLTFVGQGTERCEETLRELFPSTPLHRIDRDSTQGKTAMAGFLADIRRNEPCILLGTQMLAKGHHFPAVTLSALVEVDNGLFSTDFRALERTAQIITQVAGRAGRGEKPGRVLIQSHHVDHPMLQELTRGDYRHFSSLLLAQRQQHQLPPFSHLAMIRAEARDAASAEAFLHYARSILRGVLPPTPANRYLGPLPSTLERRKGYHRLVLSIFCANRRRLGAALKTVATQLEGHRDSRKIRWAIDVDPQDSP